MNARACRTYARPAARAPARRGRARGFSLLAWFIAWTGVACFATGCGGKIYSASGFGEDDDGAPGSSVGGDAGGGGARDDRLLPLEVGRTWPYQRDPIEPAAPVTGCLHTLDAFVAGPVTEKQEPGKTGL